MHSSITAALSLIMVLAGIGIPIMAALNAGLGARLAHPVQAAAVLFGVALVSSILALLFHSKPLTTKICEVPPQYFLGGLFVAFYVMSVTFIAPKCVVRAT